MAGTISLIQQPDGILIGGIVQVLFHQHIDLADGEYPFRHQVDALHMGNGRQVPGVVEIRGHLPAQYPGQQVGGAAAADDFDPPPAT